MKSRLVLSLISVTLISTSLCIAADAAKPAKTSLKPADKRFIENTALGNLTEVKLGELAQKNASSQKIKDFASQMVTDHTKANESLSKVATDLGVTLPTQLDSKHSALVTRFSKLTGSKFDHDYAMLMQTDHKKTVADLEKEAARGPAPLKEWSNATLSTVKQHLQMANELAAAEHAKMTH
jgi:putative membrane protein